MRAKRGFGRTHMMTLRAPRAGPVAGAGGEGTPLGGRVCHIKLSPMVCSSAHGKILCGGDTSMADCHCRCAARSVVVGPPHVWIFVPTSKDSTFPRFHVSTIPPFHHSTIVTTCVRAITKMHVSGYGVACGDPFGARGQTRPRTGEAAVRVQDT